MRGLRIKWNLAGFREVRTAPGVVADLEARANRIAAAAGDGHDVKAAITGGRGRAKAVVSTETPEAMRAEAEDLRLTSSLDAGR